MSEIKVNNIQGLEGTHGPVVSGITTMASSGAMSLPTGDTTYRGGRGRGLFMGGQVPGGVTKTVEYITIATQGNAKDFGDLTRTSRDLGALASSTRGITGGGTSPSDDKSNIMDYITISSTGNAFDFGDLNYASRGTRGLANSTRGLFHGGHDDAPAATRIYFDNIDYIIDLPIPCQAHHYIEGIVF